MNNQKAIQVTEQDIQEKTIQDTLVLEDNSSINEDINGTQSRARNKNDSSLSRNNATKYNASTKKVVPFPVKRGSNPKHCLHRLGSNINFMVIDDTWDLWFERLEMYHQLHGHCNVPKKYIDNEGFKLGKWVDNQHYQIPKIEDSVLQKRRVDKLNILNFWGPNLEDFVDYDWNMMFERLVIYQKKHGNTRVPRFYVDNDGNKLGAWVDTQRNKLPRMKNSVLRNERMKKLKSIQFGVEAWDTMFECLLLYRKEYGSTRVPLLYVDNEGKNLGRWVRNQRNTLPKLKKSALRNERMKKLNSIQFEWPSHRSDSWDKMFDRLLLFCKEHGHPRVPSTYVDDAGNNLGQWVNKQRNTLPNMGDSVLRTERMKKLNSINFEWQLRISESLDKMSERLLLFRKEHGISQVPQHYVNDAGYKLGELVFKQQQSLPKLSDSVLRDEKIEKLNGLQFDWQTLHKAEWNRMFKRLVIYHQEHGNSRVPCSYVDDAGNNLGQWVAVQRHKLPKLKDVVLREKRMKKLNSIQFEWPSHRSDSWDRMFDRLLLFCKEHGHPRVPSTYVDDAGNNLGQWVFGQRRRLPKMEKSILRDERMKKLDSIQFEWQTKVGRPLLHQHEDGNPPWRWTRDRISHEHFKFSWEVSPTKD